MINMVTLFLEAVKNNSKENWLKKKRLIFSYVDFLILFLLILPDKENILESHDIPAEEPIKFMRGQRIITTRIPKRFLNEGESRIVLNMILHGEKHIIHSANFPPTIYLQIEGGHSDSMKFLMSRSGLSAPLFEWYSIK